MQACGAPSGSMRQLSGSPPDRRQMPGRAGTRNRPRAAGSTGSGAGNAVFRPLPAGFGGGFSAGLTLRRCWSGGARLPAVKLAGFTAGGIKHWKHRFSLRLSLLRDSFESLHWCSTLPLSSLSVSTPSHTFPPHSTPKRLRCAAETFLTLPNAFQLGCVRRRY